MYKFSYDSVKRKYGEKAKLHYVDTDRIHKNISFLTNDIDSDIAEDVETRFDTSSYVLDRLLPEKKMKKQLD